MNVAEIEWQTEREKQGAQGRRGNVRGEISVSFTGFYKMRKQNTVRARDSENQRIRTRNNKHGNLEMCEATHT